MRTIKLPFRVKRPILACGADLKGAFALAKGSDAYLFDGFGDLSELDNFTRYGLAVGAAQRRLKITPQVVVCDMHPGYFSTQFAESYKLSAISCQLYRVQHHEAHIASAIVDNDIKGDVLGAAFDGTGYGTDGNIWGGEFFTGNVKKFKRAAHLDYIPMPGGEACIREPWRMAASYLWKNRDRHHFSKRRAILKIMIEKKINSPLTSSMGRLFDAVGSLVLNKENASFEAELPIELEKIADKNERGHYDFELKKGNGPILIDMSKAIKGILRDLDKKFRKPKISAKFHNTIALMILKAAERFNIKNVVLSGGVFQNRYLKDRAMKLLSESDFKVYAHLNVETNDSGIPIGQSAIANTRLTPPSQSTRDRVGASADVGVKNIKELQCA